MKQYPKRLIEVDLPIKKISEHARREKSIRHGHISTLHIWWARRPLAACRAVLCAALWPDPADSLCPEEFKQEAKDLMKKFWDPMGVGNKNYNDTIELRQSLLEFIAEFSNWDNATKKEYLDVSRGLTKTANKTLGGVGEKKPNLIDPFAGGGTIPLEGLRVGADVISLDINPVATIINKVLLEYIPKYGKKLSEEVNSWGKWVLQKAEEELKDFYPKDLDGSIPIAYLWARTIISEAPDDGTGVPVEIPLLRSMWLSKSKGNENALRWVKDEQNNVITDDVSVKYSDGSIVNVKRPRLEIFKPRHFKEVEEGTIARGNVTCPITKFVTPVASVRKQLKLRSGGTNDARLFTVVTVKPSKKGRNFRLPISDDFISIKKSKERLDSLLKKHTDSIPLLPEEPLPTTSSGFMGPPTYGMDRYDSIFTTRQLISIITFSKLIKAAGKKISSEHGTEFAIAIQTCLGLVLDKVAERLTSLSRYDNSAKLSGIIGIFSGQRLAMVWDFGEGNPLLNRSSGWSKCLQWHLNVLNRISDLKLTPGNVINASATNQPLPDDSVDLFITDPPYYNAVPYADLSDFFYILLKRTIGELHPDIFKDELSPKDEEICEMAGWDSVRYPEKNGKWFEEKMKMAMDESRRILAPNGIGVVVFAHKTTSGWENMLRAIIESGWIITGSWPIDTEMGTRLRAQNSAALASSIHLACRPRENPDGSLRTDEIGDWRDVLQELPKRINEWMPRLTEEGVVGADAIFACLGPALEIFSKYSSVEKASGEEVYLHEYLEQVWGAVSKEALNMIFEGAETRGFEDDARLTAMWLWTLPTEKNGSDSEKSTKSNFVLDYDTVRKIAQGLGGHLEKMNNLVEIKGDTVRLLPVEERTKYLFGGAELKTTKKTKIEKSEQLTLTGEPITSKEETEIWGDMKASAGNTTLDRLHQAMLLFAADRSEALKRFLVEEGVGTDAKFWRLAQSLAALYPLNTNERRWVEGLLARKKGLGL
jgi:adenine-specific DNA methylase